MSFDFGDLFEGAVGLVVGALWKDNQPSGFPEGMQSEDVLKVDVSLEDIMRGELPQVVTPWEDSSKVDNQLHESVLRAVSPPWEDNQLGGLPPSGDPSEEYVQRDDSKNVLLEDTTKDTTDIKSVQKRPPLRAPHEDYVKVYNLRMKLLEIEYGDTFDGHDVFESWYNEGIVNIETGEKEEYFATLDRGERDCIDAEGRSIKCHYCKRWSPKELDELIASGKCIYDLECRYWICNPSPCRDGGNIIPEHKEISLPGRSS